MQRRSVDRNERRSASSFLRQTSDIMNISVRPSQFFRVTGVMPSAKALPALDREIRREAVFRHDVGLALKEGYEILLYRDPIKQPAIAIHLDEQIEIAVRSAVAANSRSERPHGACPVHVPDRWISPMGRSRTFIYQDQFRTSPHANLVASAGRSPPQIVGEGRVRLRSSMDPITPTPLAIFD